MTGTLRRPPGRAVLLVHERPEECQSWVSELRRGGATCAIARTVDEAQRILHAIRFDVVMLEGASRLDVERLRRHGVTLQQLPVERAEAG